jgi:hypothetical protein
MFLMPTLVNPRKNWHHAQGWHCGKAQKLGHLLVSLISWYLKIVVAWPPTSLMQSTTLPPNATILQLVTYSQDGTRPPVLITTNETSRRHFVVVLVQRRQVQS